MNVYWLEQTEMDVPEDNDWLSLSEVIFLEGFRFAKRRADWRLGRWTAKRALAVCLDLHCFPEALSKIEIRPAPSGAPEVFIEDKLAAATISLSHRSGRAVCAVAPAAVDLGCDLELIEPRSDTFLADFFAPEEQALVTRHFAPDRLRLLALLWSGKESALKALREGLRLDTRSVIVDLKDITIDLVDWSPLEVRYTSGRVFRGWWRDADQMVRTLVSAPHPASPIPLQITARSSGCGPSDPTPGFPMSAKGN
ncbi:MAG TPA: 4'-phosphopantetheinyl transferase superfamily protein [Candidatus Sulfotelmatobacter sp.]|nr:4'-phosphopantetheinyl transferase superfamily protein [Candidatus Sulfotelmatobacter sp.]